MFKTVQHLPVSRIVLAQTSTELAVLRLLVCLDPTQKTSKTETRYLKETSLYLKETDGSFDLNPSNPFQKPLAVQ